MNIKIYVDTASVAKNNEKIVQSSKATLEVGITQMLEHEKNPNNRSVETTTSKEDQDKSYNERI